MAIAPKTEIVSHYATRRRDDCHIVTRSAAANHMEEDSLSKVDLNLVPEVIIKEEEIKTEKSDEPLKLEEAAGKEDDKPPQKIKVIDFAKLVNSSPAATPPLQTLKPAMPSAVNPNTFVLRNSVPGIRGAYSRGPQLRQPMMRNPYLIASPNPVSYTHLTLPTIYSV